ncbi:MAG: hypothetical protein ABFD98_12375 [Syntrophobacteraceae bacterium]
MNRVRGEVWRYIPSGDWFYVERKGRRYFMSLKVLRPADAGRIFRGEEPPPKLDREVTSMGAFEEVAEEAYLG